MGSLFESMVLAAALVSAGLAHAGDPPLRVLVHADAASVAMGRSVTLDVSVLDSAGTPVADCLLLPYVNGKRWGAHEVTGGDGSARFLLPLPNPGIATIAIRAIPGFHSPCWIWTPRAASPKAFLSTTFTADARPGDVSLRAAASGHCTIYLNGIQAGEASGVGAETRIDVSGSLFRTGENVLAIEAESGSGMAATAAQLRFKSGAGEQVISTGPDWQSWETAPEGWPGGAPVGGEPVRVPARMIDGLYPVDPFAAWFGGVRRDDLFAGRLLPDGAVLSEPITVDVQRRAIAGDRDPEHLVGMQWGSYFFPGGFYWNTAQAVPLTGFYDTFNPDVIRQQALWFMDMGIDFLIADWPVYIPPDAQGEQHWRDRSEFGIQQIHVTTMMLEGLAALRDEGLPVPAMVLMAFLANGPANTTATLNEELAWLYDYYIRNPRFHDLWVPYEGKPLMAVLYTGGQAASEFAGPPVDDSRFTIRYVGTQLQATHVDKLGHWSWMDGVAEPVVTYRDGKAEAVTPNAAYFTLSTGWRGPDAGGRRNGATLLRSFVPALKERPTFVVFHQWNEFTGQAEGYPYENGIYGDSYSVELSDDIEPVSLTAAGYRGDRGGWGFRYANLTAALVDLYKQEPREDSLLAVFAPVAGQEVSGSMVEVAWEAVGKTPVSFTILLDGAPVAEGIQGSAYTLDVSGIAPGKHTVTVVAEGAVTHYKLAFDRMDERLQEGVPVREGVPFVIEI